jgi:fatty-acyl-CoA synthase
MRGTMMDFPLTLNTILERFGRLFGSIEIVGRRPDRTIERTNYGAIYSRSRALAEALQKAGLARGDRVATLMWNHTRHLEAYFGIPAAGGVLHTLNLRLHPSEIAYIVNHARDRFLIVDDVLLPIFDSFKALTHFERVFVVPFCGQPTGHQHENYEDLLRTASGRFQYPQLDENEAGAMCFTSGTTGKSKGVVYSHRALVLHSFALGLRDTFGLSQHDVVLPICPMFHANAWGIPYGAGMLGTKVVFTGPHVDAESVLDLMVSEGVTAAFGVPTVWIGVLAALEKNPGRWKFKGPVRAPCGGSAPPEQLMCSLDRYGIHMIHLWGMTETTPIATLGQLRSDMLNWPDDEKSRIRTSQGVPAPFVEMRITRPEGAAPQDGKTAGEIEVRGPWVAGSYYESPESANRWTADGWFRTGDIATIDANGYARIVDRSKDVIKSGGEWISSVDLENALMGHPAVLEAAVISVPHPRWQERPLAVVVLKEGADATPQDLRSFLGSKFAKWQIPDAFVFANEIPRTSVGKFLKLKLREQYANYQWES